MSRDLYEEIWSFWEPEGDLASQMVQLEQIVVVDDIQSLLCSASQRAYYAGSLALVLYLKQALATFDLCLLGQVLRSLEGSAGVSGQPVIAEILGVLDSIGNACLNGMWDSDRRHSVLDLFHPGVWETFYLAATNERETQKLGEVIHRLKSCLSDSR